MPSPFTSVICFREEPPSRAKEAKEKSWKEDSRVASRMHFSMYLYAWGNLERVASFTKMAASDEGEEKKLGTQSYGEINILKPLKLHL